MAEVTFWFSVGSRYSYLASTQLARLAETLGCTFAWRVIDNPALLRRRGRDPFEGQPLSPQYEWSYRIQDAQRWAAYYGVPYCEPVGRITLDSRTLALAAVAGARLGAPEATGRRLLQAVFRDERRTLDHAAIVQAGAEGTGADAERFAETMDDAATAAQLEANVQAALDAGIGGVPTFIAPDGERFWGNDRLVLLAHHLSGSE